MNKIVTLIKKTDSLPKPDELCSWSRPLKYESVIIYDLKLAEKKAFKNWLKQFKYKIPVNGGEALKTIRSYESILIQVQEFNILQKIQFVSVGGGSVGDFVGFLASTFQRGAPLIHIPSTWLSALDSAHGGKTGLNLNSAKNQIGTFWPAQVVILSKSILLEQPPELTQDAYGEYLKIGFLNQPQMLKSKKFDKHNLWNQIIVCINGKLKIVNKDPLEKKGIRHLLNLGHTMGHVFEAQFKFTHGQSVLLGLDYIIRLSHQIKMMNHKSFIQCLDILDHIESYQDLRKSLIQKYIQSNLQNRKNLFDLLNQDKKKSINQKIRVILLKNIAKPIILEMDIESLLIELDRQMKLVG